MPAIRAAIDLESIGLVCILCVELRWIDPERRKSAVEMAAFIRDAVADGWREVDEPCLGPGGRAWVCPNCPRTR